MAKNSTRGRRSFAPVESWRFRAALASRWAEARADLARMQLIAAIKPDGNVTPGPGLTLLDVMFLEHQHGAALGRSRAARVAATAPRKGKERRELAAAIERVQANSRRRLPEAELAEKLNTSRKRIRWARGKSY